jgi:hypothetical protein
MTQTLRFSSQAGQCNRYLGTQDLEAVIVDNIRRDPALLLLAEVGRMTRGAPPVFVVR